MKVLNSLRTAKERHPDCQNCEAKRTVVCDL
ncbi:50S ribosomal protein L36 [Escherichia coli]|uniref:50S ribosomal protein L36 n=1 Tax=Escherichia coli TaxID=562 RepID=A0A376P0X2_ECOLX|nr:50S ribosomal protein L36 [Escherichia coli]